MPRCGELHLKQTSSSDLAALRWPSHGHRWHMYRKFREVWTRGFWVMRETDRHADCNTSQPSGNDVGQFHTFTFSDTQLFTGTNSTSSMRSWSNRITYHILLLSYSCLWLARFHNKQQAYPTIVISHSERGQWHYLQSRHHKFVKSQVLNQIQDSCLVRDVIKVPTFCANFAVLLIC